MIVVNLFGRLGNQMFQYALGKVLAGKLKTPLVLEYTYNRIDKDFNIEDILFLGDVFNTPVDIFSQNKIKLRFPYNYTPTYLKYLIRLMGLKPYLTIKEIYEKSQAFRPDILDLEGNVYLHGYWQSPKYFEGYEEVIRTSFTFKKILPAHLSPLADRINNTNAISLHVRGQDYVNRPQTAAVHKVCGLDYYKKAVELMQEKVPDAYFFVFTDDPEYTRQFLSLDFPHELVTASLWNKDADYDMQLMSLCRHHIIANSSFSWWGAWLNPDLDKIVCMPDRWFADEIKNQQIQDIYPDGWLRL